jgi:hypothetical protein
MDVQNNVAAFANKDSIVPGTAPAIRDEVYALRT